MTPLEAQAVYALVRLGHGDDLTKLLELQPADFLKALVEAIERNLVDRALEEKLDPGVANSLQAKWREVLVHYLGASTDGWQAKLLELVFPGPVDKIYAKTAAPRTTALASGTAHAVSMPTTGPRALDPEIPTDSEPLTVPQLSALHRVSDFCRAVGISVKDFLAAKALLGMDPFAELGPASIATTFRSIEEIRRLQTSGISARLWQFLLRHETQPGESPGPNLKDIEEAHRRLATVGGELSSRYPDHASPTTELVGPALGEAISADRVARVLDVLQRVEPAPITVEEEAFVPRPPRSSSPPTPPPSPTTCCETRLIPRLASLSAGAGAGPRARAKTAGESCSKDPRARWCRALTRSRGVAWPSGSGVRTAFDETYRNHDGLLPACGTRERTHVMSRHSDARPIRCARRIAAGLGTWRRHGSCKSLRVKVVDQTITVREGHDDQRGLHSRERLPGCGLLAPERAENSAFEPRAADDSRER